MGRWLLGLVMLLCACADMLDTVRKHASDDLACSEDRIYVVDAELGIYRLRGCGREASYRCSDGKGIGQVDCVRLDRVDEVGPGAARPGRHHS